MRGTVGVGSPLQTQGVPVGQELAWVKPNALRDYPDAPCGTGFSRHRKGAAGVVFPILDAVQPCRHLFADALAARIENVSVS